jgi:hypothetical protein
MYSSAAVSPEVREERLTVRFEKQISLPEAAEDRDLYGRDDSRATFSVGE